MGWCSGTEIMDTALGAAYAVVSEVIEAYAQGNADAEAIRARADDVLRPFVTTLAEKLRDNDWDCIDESSYFDRFQQEMLCYDDRDYERWLVERIADHEPGSDQRRDATDRLTKLYGRTKTDGAG